MHMQRKKISEGVIWGPKWVYFLHAPRAGGPNWHASSSALLYRPDSNAAELETCQLGPPASAAAAWTYLTLCVGQAMQMQRKKTSRNVLIRLSLLYHVKAFTFGPMLSKPVPVHLKDIIAIATAQHHSPMQSQGPIQCGAWHSFRDEQMIKMCASFVHKLSSSFAATIVHSIANQPYNVTAAAERGFGTVSFPSPTPATKSEKDVSL